MAGREAHRRQQVRRLRPLRQHHPERDLIGLHGHMQVALVLHEAILVDEALEVVRIRVVAAHADHVRLGPPGLQVFPRHHELAHQPRRLAHIQLMRPAGGVLILFLRQAPPIHLVAQRRRDPRAGGGAIVHTVTSVVPAAPRAQAALAVVLAGKSRMRPSAGWSRHPARTRRLGQQNLLQLVQARPGRPLPLTASAAAARRMAQDHILRLHAQAG